MNPFVRTLVVAVALLALIVPATGSAQNDRQLRTDLSGFNEVHAPSISPTTGLFNPGNGSIFSTGSGRVELKVDKQHRQVRYELSYAFPDAASTPVAGTQFVNQAHLHFGQKHTTGGIPVWLCQSPDNVGPVGTPQCPSPSGTVTGIITFANVLALPGQGFPAGEDGFDALLEALQNGNIYANVHTDRFPPGEIRGHLGDHDHNN
jgi:hypothetical protein